ncbi:MAG: glutamate 5-kinase [Deltaproteobacteria bacterium]|nr:glutamate 5-kinase [Deltaproteobacteria bacterium]
MSRQSRDDAFAEIAKARRIVVKVGSAILAANGGIADEAFADIARQISELADSGRDVVLVSSGAIAIGNRDLGWDIPSESIPEKQAAAAVGQIGLTGLYKQHFAHFGRQVAQILLTRSGLEDHERFLNARHTLGTLLRNGVIPIVNENDTVATDEIRFGDNDNLSATVVNLVAADLLIVLTDVDGLYAEPPREGAPEPHRFEVVDQVTPEIQRAAQGSTSGIGRGGMTTKLEAAQVAARGGAATVLCNGTTRTRGEVSLDAGAVHAVEDGGKSLLPAGITAVRGRFGIGDAISCLDPSGREIARGLSSYSSDDLTRIAGQATSGIQQMLGYSNGDEVIHRDDLVVLRDETTP